MFRLQKNKSLLHSIRDRETGLGGSPKQLGFNILRQLIISPNSLFAKVWQHKCVKRICCENGKLYMHDFNLCLSLWGKDSCPTYLCKFEQRNGPKKKDSLTCAGRHMSNDPGPLDVNYLPSYRGFLLILSNDSYLRSFDDRTGKILQEVYLGPKHRSYTHVSWETLGDRIFVTCNVRKRSLNNNHTEHIYASIIVFTVFPLEFLAMTKISESAFGKNVAKINVSMGTLVIGSGTPSLAHVRIYDFNHILENNISFQTKLNEQIKDDFMVGVYPSGIPVNCEIKTSPPLLFVVDCSDYAVHFGGFPWHYMVQNNKHSAYEIYEVETNNVPENNKLAFTFSGFETEQAHFHYDCSERIIYETANEIQVHKICSRPSQNALVKKLFSMNFYNAELKNRRERARSLRQLDPRSYFLATKSVMSMDYEDEMDLIALLGFNPQDALCAGKVHIYDNYTGKFLKSVNLHIEIDETLKYDLIFNLDKLVVTYRMLDTRFRCIVYSLCWPESSVKTQTYLCNKSISAR